MTPDIFASMTETGRRFVNNWDCDENNHLNVQFYIAYFEQAEPHFWLAAGLKGDPPRSLVRHHRFHKELRPAAGIAVRTALAADEAGAAVLCHVMLTIEGDLSAACLTLLDEPFAALMARCPAAPVLDAIPGDIMPRGPRAPDAPAALAEVEQAGFIAAHRAVVLPRDCAADGTMTAQMHVARLSDSASHIWHHLGVGNAWRKQHELGTVAVEKKLTLLEPVRAGTPLLVMTGLTDRGRKTITFSHFIFDAAAERAAAVARTTALAMSLKERRAVAWPGDKAAEMDGKLCVMPGAV